MGKAKVYFTKKITPETVIEMYKALGIELKGKVAVKVHSGEKGNQNFLHPEFLKPMIDYIGGTVVECNTAYPGERNDTIKHTNLLKEHGWSTYFDVDIMDAKEDYKLDVVGGTTIKENYVGKNLLNYDSLLVLSHFKGHPMGGYGGALKQLSIGCASTNGKCYIHSAGTCLDQRTLWDNVPSDNKIFCAAMADAAKSVVDLFKGNAAYVNLVCNLSVDCDCCAIAEDPCMADIGILSSLDPVAIDRACMDLIYASKDKGRDHFLERVQSRSGEHTIDMANDIGVGSKEYELVELD